VDRPLVLFAPGAGAPSTSGWMTAWAGRLAVLGEVVRFDYPYAAAGRRRPDPLPDLVASHREALAQARGRPGRAVVLAGKSMGSRVGCHLALEEEVAALVCFGYPLRGASGALRDEVLLRLRTPILFLQGTRDALAPLHELQAVRARMAAPSTLHVVEGGDHSLAVGVRALRARGQTQADVDGEVLEAVRRFLGPLAGARPRPAPP